MKTSFRGAVDAAVYLVAFFFLQIIPTVLFTLCLGDTTLILPLSTGVSAVLTILLFHFARFAPLGSGYIKTRPCVLLAWLAVLSVSFIAPSQLLEEMIPTEMPGQTVAALSAIMSHPLGLLVVGILAPVSEEMVFRGAILRRLLSCYASPWLAIAVSAVLFGLVHGNVPQFVHATVVGLFLGWVYWRTGSILPGLVVHWANNLTAFLVCTFCPRGMDASLPEIFGGNLLLMYSVTAVSTLVAAFSLWRVVSKVRLCERTHGKGGKENIEL